MSKNNSYITPIKELFDGTKLFIESSIPYESIDNFKNLTNYLYNNPKDASIEVINYVKSHPHAVVAETGALFLPSICGFFFKNIVNTLSESNSNPTFLNLLTVGQKIYQSWESMPTSYKILSITFVAIPFVGGWESYADAKDAYKGGACYGRANDEIMPFLKCASNKSALFKDCYEGMARNNMEKYGQTFEGYVFAQHECIDSKLCINTEINPVSITHYNSTNNTTDVCIYSIVQPNSIGQANQNVLKVCLSSSSDLPVTVSYTQIPLSRVFEEMEIGVAIRHGAINTQEEVNCGFFTRAVPLRQDMDSQDVFCIVSNDGGIPQQTCINPNSHEVVVRPMTLEEFKNSHTNTSSTYTIINDPASREMDSRQDTQANLDTCPLLRPTEEVSPNPYYSNSTLPNIEQQRGWFNSLIDYFWNLMPEENNILEVLTSRSDSPSDNNCGVSLQGAFNAWWYQDPSYINSDC